jgi:hypothetical protein
MVERWVKCSIIGQNGSAIENLRSDFAHLFGSGNHMALDAGNALQIFHVAGHRFIVFRADCGPETSTALKVAVDFLRRDQVLDVVEHPGSFEKEFGGLFFTA